MRPKGQALTESVMLLPLFLLVAFILFQAAHLGIGIAVMNYGASSVARQAVAENGFNSSEAEQKLKGLLTAGLKFKSVQAAATPDSDSVTTNLKVTTCGELTAYPFVGPFLAKAIHSNTTPADEACTGASKWLGPVGIMGPPYRFLVEGSAVVRMNYNSKVTN